MTLFNGASSFIFLLSLSGVRAGLFDFLKYLPKGDEVFVNKNCTDEVRAAASCTLTAFTGMYMCRPFFDIFSIESKHTVCVRNFAEGVTLAFEQDECGCCGGTCPPLCACDCGTPDENGVYPSKMIEPVLFGDKKMPAMCVPNEVARRLTVWGGRVVCAPACDAAAATEEGSGEDDNGDP